jgi:hypothetical protein
MLRTLSLPDGSGALELLEETDGHIASIVCRDLDGSVRWQAEPPEGEGDSWVAVSLVDDGGVSANSWSGWRVELAVTTGTEAGRHFTK